MERTCNYETVDSLEGYYIKEMNRLNAELTLTKGLLRSEQARTKSAEAKLEILKREIEQLSLDLKAWRESP